jgi:hypothetical protein
MQREISNRNRKRTFTPAPGRDPLIPASEMARRLGLKGEVLRRFGLALGKPDLGCGSSTGAGRPNGRLELFRTSRLEELRPRFAAVPNTGPGRRPRARESKPRERVCEECGLMFRSNVNSVCPSCRGVGLNRDPDPTGTMIRPRRQSRRCPDCGGPLWEGQYRCEACKQKKRALYDAPDPWLDAAAAPLAG